MYKVGVFTIISSPFTISDSQGINWHLAHLIRGMWFEWDSNSILIEIKNLWIIGLLQSTLNYTLHFVMYTFIETLWISATFSSFFSNFLFFELIASDCIFSMRCFKCNCCLHCKLFLNLSYSLINWKHCCSKPSFTFNYTQTSDTPGLIFPKGI